MISYFNRVDKVNNWLPTSQSSRAGLPQPLHHPGYHGVTQGWSSSHITPCGSHGWFLITHQFYVNILLLLCPTGVWPCECDAAEISQRLANNTGIIEWPLQISARDISCQEHQLPGTSATKNISFQEHQLPGTSAARNISCQEYQLP